MNRVKNVCLFFIVIILSIISLQKLLRGGNEEDITRMQLDNGLVAILKECHKTKKVAVEALYKVGLVNEQKGCAQISHLLEHLLCRGATKSFAAGESFKLLQAKGMANAETLADWTHYDYILPSSDIELALKVEAERMSSLTVTEDLIKQEIPRCLSEVDMVEKNPRAGMLKFAFAALNQVRSHGSKIARIRGDLQSISVDQIKDFYKRFYRPDNSILVVIGHCRKERVIELIKKYFAGIPPSRSEAIITPALTNGQKELVAKWDSNTEAVFICFPAPDAKEHPIDNMALTFLGNHLFQKLLMDEDIKRLANMSFCTNYQWNLRSLPFVVYATAKVVNKPSSMSVEALKNRLIDHIEAVRTTRLTDAEMSMLRAISSFTVHCQDLDNIQTPSGSTFDLLMGNVAIQIGLREMFLGTKYDKMVNRFNSLTSDDLLRIAQKYLAPEKRTVTILKPSASFKE